MASWAIEGSSARRGPLITKTITPKIESLFILPRREFATHYAIRKRFSLLIYGHCLCLFLASRPFRLGHSEIYFGICSRWRSRWLYRGQRSAQFPDVARLRPVGIGENSLDRLKDRGPGFTVAKVIKHHRTAPDLSDRVGNAFAGDVRSASVNGFEHAGKFTFRVEVSRGSVADGAGYRGTKITEYVAEEVGCDNDINPVGVEDKVRREDVNVELVYFYTGIFLAMAVTRSSQYGMVIEIPLLLVALVRCFSGRLCASSKA